MQTYRKHYEEKEMITADPASVFSYADNPINFSSHMNTSSTMMGGGKMATKVDEGKGQRVGSHIAMTGEIFGFNLFLDEVVTIHKPPLHKAWQTVGKINLLVIDHYLLGFEIIPKSHEVQLRVYIDYNLSKSWKTKWLGIFLGDMYAKWCVKQMLVGVKDHFERQVN